MDHSLNLLLDSRNSSKTTINTGKRSFDCLKCMMMFYLDKIDIKDTFHHYYNLINQVKSKHFSQEQNLFVKDLLNDDFLRPCFSLLIK